MNVLRLISQLIGIETLRLRNITDFALNGLSFSSLKGLIPCLVRENFHGFWPQWLYILIPRRIYTMSPKREFSNIKNTIYLMRVI